MLAALAGDTQRMTIAPDRVQVFAAGPTGAAFCEHVNIARNRVCLHDAVTLANPTTRATIREGNATSARSGTSVQSRCFPRPGALASNLLRQVVASLPIYK